MELTYLTNAPREIALGGAVYRGRALTLADLCEVLAWLEDRLPPEGGPLRIGGEPARLALASTEGLAVVLHLALLSCHPALTRVEARTLAAAMTAEDEARLIAVAFRRRPAYGLEPDPAPRDLAEVTWGPVFEALTRHQAWAYPEAARLTLDQYDNHAARGELPGPDDLPLEAVQAMWDNAVQPETPDV